MRILTTLILLLLAGAASGQGRCSAKAFSGFDFWLGDWTVKTADGTVAGQNRIDKRDGGCVLIERWSSASGGSGTSLNYFDVAADQWVQVWGGSGGSQIVIRGGLTDGSMVLTGTLTTVGDGSSVPFRGTWTPLEDGRVRQFFEQSLDDGDTWQPWFEGFYEKAPP
ncbi:MAG: hypothetical protein AAFZ58_17360 [Pseudomonadota bacterium]